MSWPVRFGIVDFLGQPAGEVQRELVGLALENGIDPEDLDSVKFMLTDHIADLGELRARSIGTAIDYYNQTWDAFIEGMDRAGITPGSTVLEIGAERRLPMLVECRERGAKDCYGLNLFFHLDHDAPIVNWCWRSVADMHSLPFAAETFDVVVISATVHHSTDLTTLFGEIRRVLRHGGRAVIVNEAVEGYLKRFGSRRCHDRHTEIHEEKIRYRQYRKAIKRSGLKLQPFVPRYFIERLKRPLHREIRFYHVAKTMSAVTRRHPRLALALLRAGRVPAQVVLGFPFNAVLVNSG
jgi:SAM-dependent methyltransferase